MPVCSTPLREVCDHLFVDDRELWLSWLPDLRLGRSRPGSQILDPENTEIMPASTLAALERMSA
jgi:hypothetical protein